MRIIVLGCGNIARKVVGEKGVIHPEKLAMKGETLNKIITELEKRKIKLMEREVTP